MALDFTELKHVLEEWPKVSMTGEPKDNLYQRIYQILSEPLEHGKLDSKRDLIALFYHILLSRREYLKTDVSLYVPVDENWPDPNEWKNNGFTVHPVRNTHLQIFPTPWLPRWLTGDTSEVLQEIYSEYIYRKNITVPSDPCVLDAVGFEKYTSPGQREAVRSSIFAPSGSTLVVNLPTGSGKSLAGYLPIFLSGGEGEFVLFVVPTIALALDQARQVRSLLKTIRPAQANIPLAWHGGLSSEERQIIKNNIRNGHQPILFTSPESVCGSLRWALYDAVDSGFLKLFVIDEAHLVAQWGIEFRPEFQAISGIWRGLLKKSNNGFKTILMTATLTEETLETLRMLFSAPRGFQVISGVNLRIEPRYWHYKARNPIEKKALILEAVRFGPRPFILYVTKPEEAENWFHILKSEGYKRIARFHGNTDSRSRMKIIDDWIGNKLDAIVATSAFGVGMDKSDIRMILHATVPENLDRYYQEVGRGGRDGKALFALTIYDNNDLEWARNLAFPTIISEELGMARWQKLIDERKPHPTDPSMQIINLSIVPPNLSQQSDYNRAWNMRTVLLMVRAGAIQLEADPPPVILREDEDDFSEMELTNYLNETVISFRDSNHLDKRFWETVVAVERNKSSEGSRRNFTLLEEILENGREVGGCLAELYSLNRNGVFASVPKICGGCSSCRKETTKNDETILPCVVPVTNVEVEFEDDWDSVFPMLTVQPVIVTYPRSQELNLSVALEEILPIIVRRFGIREIVTTNNSLMLEKSTLRQIYKHTSERFVVHRHLAEDDCGEYTLPIARVTILHPWGKHPIPEKLLWTTKNTHLIFAPEDVPDSEHPNRSYCDVATNYINMEQFRMRLK